MSMRKILCGGSYGGDDCNRWLARVENGCLFIKCPRCRRYHAEPLVNLIADLRGWLDELEEMRADLEADGLPIDGTPHSDDGVEVSVPKGFGN